MSLASALSRRRALGRCAFVPFLTAGDPSLSATKTLARGLSRQGADILELGVPFSDPVADGPVIQAADMRALARGSSLRDVIALVASLRKAGETIPVILFTYLNPIMSVGFAKFAALCGAAGVDGVLAVDLPAEESGALSAALKKYGVELVLLASPTTSNARLEIIGAGSGSIVYYVSREGVTGVRAGLAQDLASRLKTVRHLTRKPLIVGFGVATAEQARVLARHADGVVVGSALVKAAGEAGTAAKAARAVGRKAAEILRGLEN